MLRALIRVAGLLAPAFILAAAEPPIIERDLFFGDPEISGAQISPDGKFIAFMKPLNGIRNIWVKGALEPFGDAKPVTADRKRPIPGFAWSRDSKFILFAQDKAGDENFNVYSVNPSQRPPGAETPLARNLTEIRGVRAMVVGVPKTEPDYLYVGINDRDKAWHDLYKVRISSGIRALIRKNTDRIVGWTFDIRDQLRLALRSPESGETEIMRVDPDGLKKIYSCGLFETCVPLRFHADNKRVYMMTNKGDATNLIRLVLMDPATGSEEPVEGDPLNKVDFGGALFSEVSNRLIATFYTDEKLRPYFKDKNFEADYSRLQKELPGKEVRFGSRTRDEQLWTVIAFSDTEPGETYLFDRKTKKLTRQFRVFEQLPREHLASMEPVRYESSDGLEIPAYLTLPKGAEAKNLPLIVVPHGGPWARDNWGYNSTAQFLANRGYAVLSPNFRGSTGYGKKFLNSGNKQWGQKMQDDITWGVKHLVAKGIADPKRVAIMGTSYGGYATLAGVAFTPDLYAAAVSVVGPSNLITLLESIPPYWESGRKQFYERMGDPTTPDGKAQLERQSPLNSASKIKTPLMVIQGANDPRVNKAESDQVVIALRDRNFPVEYLVAPDEGHGFARAVNRLAMYAAAEKFLAKHLGGRHQEAMTLEVSDRLRELTVDPKTVKLAAKVDPASVSVPKPSGTLRAGTYTYAARMQMGEKSLPLKYTTTIKEEAAGWVVTDAMMTGATPTTDSVTLDKDSLVVLSRSVKQGPLVIELAFADGKASGSMTISGQKKPVTADLGGPLFADGAGAPYSVGCLPLAEGYAATYRIFDFRQQKAKVMQLKVAGVESVSVPAGKFETFRVEITSPDGPDRTTVWIDKASRKPAKVSILLPQANGATLTAELAE